MDKKREKNNVKSHYVSKLSDVSLVNWSQKKKKKKMFNKPNYFSKTTDYNVGGVFWDLLCLNFSFQILSSNS